MKELTIEQKAKAYDEAIKRAIKVLLDCTPEEQKVVEYIFSELKESEDELMRVMAIKAVHAPAAQSCIKSWGINPDDVIAWLEKQGEHANFCNKIQIGDKVTRNKDGVLVNLSQLKRVAKKDEKQVEQKPADKYNIRGIKSKHAEGKLGEMIKEMKSPEESLGISSKEYNDIVDECLYDESKSADKVEPKFKIEKGKWYVCIKDLLDNYANKAFRKGDTYLSTQDESLIPSNSNVPFEVVCPDTYFRDWTIQDAKPGDVLAIESENDYPSPFIAIYKERGLNFFNSHCFVAFDGKFYVGENGHSTEDIHPATKEQRNTLEKAMADAGYEWNAEKKELKKIAQNPVIEMKTPEESLGIDSDTYNKIVDECVYGEQKSAWSEEDEEVLNLIIVRLHSHPNVDLEEYSKEYNWLNYNLKFLKERYSWKPTEEQLKQLRKYCPDNTALTALYEYLKQL